MKKLLTLAVLAAVAASCTQSEVEDVKQSNEYIGIASATVNNMALTRAGEGSPLNQGSLGLFVTTEGDDIFKVDNMKWSYAEETGWTSLSNLAYEGDGKQSAYAYHPYRPEAATTSFNFSIDNEKTDLLWWKSDGKLTSKTLNIDFSHALSKLTINLKKSEEVAGDELGQVTICGTKKNGIVDLIAQTWNTETGEIADLTTEQYGVELAEGFDKTVWSTLIPQTVSAMTVSVEVGSKTYTWTGTEQEFLSGHAYTLNLTVGREVAAIGEVNVTDWTLEETPEEGNADYVTSYLTGEELRTYMEEQLASNTDITINLKPNAGYADFRIIRDAIESSAIEDGINLTITGAKRVPGRVFAIENDVVVSNLKSVTLPDVLEIETDAFNECINLSLINAPEVVKIGEYAFRNTQITEISFPKVRTIDRGAFIGCGSLVSINLPEVANIGCETFRWTAIKNLFLPKMPLIDNWTFMDCPALESVNLPETTVLGGESFRNCPLLEIVLAPKVNYIGEHAFAGCTSIKNVQLTAEGNIEVDKYAWSFNPEECEPSPVNGQIDLILNNDKENEITNENEWKGFTFKSITFEE
ncbi:MAG: fimbrillin family protein [Bacteroidaceae bacterium]|nr:fimbrillin family protein [Bacteroidaceae bacterium]